MIPPADDPRVDLAILRSELAWDRTLLAWVRTALSLIAAGVAFDKGVLLLHQARLAAGTALVRSSHFAGISVTSVSILLLVIVALKYLSSVRALARLGHHNPPRVTSAFLIAMLAAVLGCTVLIVLFISDQGS